MMTIRILVALTVPMLAMTLIPLRSDAQELQTIRVSSFTPRREITLGSDLGFFARHGIRIEWRGIQSSEQQAQDLLDGFWDITNADADNYVYWTQDKGADFLIFMAGEMATDNDFWVTSDIQSFDDLRGKVIVTDSAFSGQSTVVRLMMQEHGLQIDRDYTFLPLGSNRLPAMLDGRASGASMGSNTADTDAAREGLVHVLARGADYVPIYPSVPWGTTRRWATAHPDLLLGFIAAMIDTKEWLLDPSNEQAAIESIMGTDLVGEETAQRLYRAAVASIDSISTEAQVRDDLVQMVEDLRVRVGLMDAPAPPRSNFVSRAWYDLALRLRDITTQ